MIDQRENRATTEVCTKLLGEGVKDPHMRGGVISRVLVTDATCNMCLGKTKVAYRPHAPYKMY